MIGHQRSCPAVTSGGRCDCAMNERQTIRDMERDLKLQHEQIAQLHERIKRKPAASHAPVYAAMYPTLADIARAHGYALAIHGSIQRDFDLVAIPWTESPSDHDVLIAAMCDKYVIRLVGEPRLKSHGRIAYTLSVQWGECAIDLSIMPRAPMEDGK